MKYEDIPDYVREQIEQLQREKESGFVGINTRDTAMLFINMAKFNGRLTEDEADQLRQLVKKIDS